MTASKSGVPLTRRPSSIDVQPIAGSYQVQKADRRRTMRHDTFSSAERAAEALVASNPGCTFVITQEVARVTPRSRSKELGNVR